MIIKKNGFEMDTLRNRMKVPFCSEKAAMAVQPLLACHLPENCTIEIFEDGGLIVSVVSPPPSE